MSDELFDTEEEVGGEDVGGGGRKVGFLPGLLIQILKWAGIIVGAIIFIVTVVVVTMKIMGTGTQSQTRIPATEEYQSKPPVYDWYSGIGEIRGSTADEVRRTFIVEPNLGYDQGDRQLQTELIARNIQLREIISTYFASRTSSQLQGVENRQRVKEDLKRQINDILSNGKVRDVAFTRYEIIEF